LALAILGLLNLGTTLGRTLSVHTVC